MNANYHTHEVKIEEGITGCTIIRYGDQSKYLFSTPTKRKLARAAKRVIREHNKQSVKAGKRAKTCAKVDTDKILAKNARKGW